MALVSALAVSLAVCAAAIPLGRRTGFLDRPSDPELKIHEGAVVPLGGLGLVAGVTAGQAVAGTVDGGLLLCAVGMLALGLADDRRGLEPVPRLAAEAGIGALLFATTDLPSSYDSVGGFLIVVALVVVMTNAVNLLDGLDGLAGTVGAVTGLGIALLAASRDLETATGLAIAGALAAFLVFNWTPARLFLGDNGAYALGLYISYGVVGAAPARSATLIPALALGGVFVVDLVATLLRRRLAGVPLFAGDRSHLYDQLRDRGMAVPRIAIAAGIAQAAFAGLALLLSPLGWGPVLAAAIDVIAAILALLHTQGFLTTRRN